MKRARRLLVLTVLMWLGHGVVAVARAQGGDDDDRAITARVHATFEDATGGLGVLNGDLTIERFEVRIGAVTAVGRVTGILADSKGNPLGRVSQELALPVSNVTSTCNQLRMDLAESDADLLGVRVRLESQAAGFDSRDGVIPRALGELCRAGDLLRGHPTPASLARALNDIVAAIRPKPNLGREM
jgi:hypothetical protein